MKRKNYRPKNGPVAYGANSPRRAPKKRRPSMNSERTLEVNVSPDNFNSQIETLLRTMKLVYDREDIGSMAFSPNVLQPNGEPIIITLKLKEANT